MNTYKQVADAIEALKTRVDNGSDFSFSVPFDASPETRSLAGFIIDCATEDYRRKLQVIAAKNEAAKLADKKRESSAKNGACTVVLTVS